jgi:uncharacterized protein (DUF1330 family)
LGRTAAAGDDTRIVTPGNNVSHPQSHRAQLARENIVPAYVISDVTVRDPDQFQAYRERAAASIEKHGGRYLARGGHIERLEGEWDPHIIIVVEFPDTAQAQAWYRSDDYAAALAFRDAALSRDLILVEGV